MLQVERRSLQSSPLDNNGEPGTRNKYLTLLYAALYTTEIGFVFARMNARAHHWYV